MESLDTTAAYLMEELLDFPADFGGEDPSSTTAVFSADKVDCSGLSPEECIEEEELEWLMNKDAFPTVDTFVDIMNVNPICVPRGCQFKHRSPVSVLENITNITTSSSSNSTNASTMTTCLPGVPVRRVRTLPSRKRRYGQQLALFSHNFRMSIKKINSGNVTKTSGNGNSIGRKCQHCQAEKTPQWRAGPMGAKTLCNACGVRYKSGRLMPEYRPANSPTFSSKLHSNSHRKVVEMRRQKQGSNSDVVIAAASAG